MARLIYTLYLEMLHGANHEVLTKMWGHGMVYVTQFEPAKIPYFCKNERLDMYPSGTKLFTKSGNCKMPKPVKMTPEKFEQLTKGMNCTYSKSVALFKTMESQPNKMVNKFIYKNYEKKGNDKK